MNAKFLITKRLKQLESHGESIENYFNIIHSNKNQLFSEKGNVKTTYGQCELYSKKLGFMFLDKFKDIPKHSFIGIMMENRLEFITCFYGLLMAGYKPMLLNVKLNNDLNNDIIKRLNIKYIICDKDYGFGIQLLNVSELDYDKLSYQETEFEWEDEFAISTSATSMNIKICVYDGPSICEQIKNMHGIYKTNKLMSKGYRGQIKHIAFLPFYHIFGLMAEYFWFTLINSSYVFLEDYSSETILKTIRDYKVTHIFAVPLLWNAVNKSLHKQLESMDQKTKDKFMHTIHFNNRLQSGFPKLGNFIARKIFKKVRSKVFGETPIFLVSGGSDILDETLRVINGLGYHLYNGYGMSEIGITSVDLSKKAKQRVAGSIGKPFSQVEYKISEEGILLVKSKGLCKKIITKDNEYLIDKNEYFSTGDFANEKNGSYFLYGRNDDVVLSETGEKINPTLVEKHLKLKYVDRYVVMAIEEEGKEYLSLLIEIDKSFDQTKINNIINNVVENLNLLNDFNYHIEKVYYTYDKIVSPSMIKISRKAISKWIKTNKITIHHFNDLKVIKLDSLTKEQLEISKFVIEAMSKTLDVDVDNIRLESHFIYDLGGTSLDFLTLISLLKEKYDYEYNLDEVSYTVIEFTNYIIMNLEGN